MLKTHKQKRGFTLVELSIVLVIIGLIIGGVLTSKQIMQNAEVTNAFNSLQAYEAQFQTYVQNYGAIPGNDASAATRFSSSNLTVYNGSGGGTMTGLFDDSSAASSSGTDTTKLWADLRAAGLVKGEVSTTQPANPFGGIYGFQSATNAFGTLTGNILCLNDVPGDAASAIDSRLDDGIPNGGSVQAFQQVTNLAGEIKGATVATSYTAGNAYTVCIGM